MKYLNLDACPCVMSYLVPLRKLSLAAGDMISSFPCRWVSSPEPGLGTYSAFWCFRTWWLCRATLGGDRLCLHCSQSREIIMVFRKQTNKLEIKSSRPPSCSPGWSHVRGYRWRSSPSLLGRSSATFRARPRRKFYFIRGIFVLVTKLRM